MFPDPLTARLIAAINCVVWGLVGLTMITLLILSAVVEPRKPYPLHSGLIGER